MDAYDQGMIRFWLTNQPFGEEADRGVSQPKHGARFRPQGAGK